MSRAATSELLLSSFPVTRTWCQLPGCQFLTVQFYVTPLFAGNDTSSTTYVCLNDWQVFVHTGSRAFRWSALGTYLFINTETYVATKRHGSVPYMVAI